MISSFSFELPKGIFFGPASRENLPQVIKLLGNKVLVVAGEKWFLESGWKQKFDKLLSGFVVSVINCPSGEPTITSVNTMREQAKKIDPEVIVGIGGGSVLDTAKAVAGLLPSNEPVEEYMEGVGSGRAVDSPGVPWVAMPTTAGTGTEVTKNAVIKSAELGVKKSIRSPHFIAAYAIVDPELTLELPVTLTGLSGMDALTQLIESFVSKKSKPLPKALVRDAFGPMLGALRVLTHSLSNIEARTDAAFGALVSGIALANSGLGAAHGFASGMGGMFGIPHGLICAIFLAPVLRANSSAIREQISDLVLSSGFSITGDAFEWLLGEIEELMEAFDLQREFRSYDIPLAKITEIAERSMGSSMSGNPVELSLERREEILREVLT